MPPDLYLLADTASPTEAGVTLTQDSFAGGRWVVSRTSVVVTTGRASGVNNFIGSHIQTGVTLKTPSHESPVVGAVSFLWFLLKSLTTSKPGGTGFSR